MNIIITEQAQQQNLGIESAPHLHARMTTNMIMGITFIAMLPAAIAFYYYTGFGFVWQFLISYATAAVCEILVALLRHRPVLSGVGNFSAAVTCLIMAFTLPPLLPWYLTCAATVFAILLVKEAFGGLGMNIFNPAMAGFIFLFVSASGFMFRTWVVPVDDACAVLTPSATMEVIFDGKSPLELKSLLREQEPNGQETKNQSNASGKGASYTERSDANGDAFDAKPDSTSGATLNSADGTSGATATGSDATSGASAKALDGRSGATMLEKVKSSRKSGNKDLSEILGDLDRTPYIWIACMFALGGIALMILRIIIVKMALAFFIGIALFSGIGHMLWPELIMPVTDQLLLGGTAICGFFIITDPVTNAGTSKGRIAFALLCALLIVAIRALGSYSDSVAFSVMLSNAAAPLIDVLTRRRAFGHGYKKGELE